MKRISCSGLLLLFFTVIFAARQKPDNVKIGDLQNAALTISANIYFGDNDEVRLPVETDFYLLPKSVIEILKGADFRPQDENGNFLNDEPAYFAALSGALAGSDEENVLSDFLIRENIERRKIVKITTNENGTGTAKSVETGNYTNSDLRGRV